MLLPMHSKIFQKKQVQLAQIYGGKGDIRKYFILETATPSLVLEMQPHPKYLQLERSLKNPPGTMFYISSFIGAFARNGKNKGLDFGSKSGK